MSNTVEVPFAIKGLDRTIQSFKEDTTTLSSEEYTLTVYTNKTCIIQPTLNSTEVDWEDNTIGQIIINEKPTGRYTKKYNKIPIWDFGDGTKVKEYSPTHYYTTPGKYVVSCSFFDITRQAYKNTEKCIIYVRDLFDTKVEVDDSVDVLENIPISKINQIGRFQLFVSSSFGKELPLKVDRVWKNRDEEDEQYHYSEISDFQFPQLWKYWTFLDIKYDTTYDTKKKIKKMFVPVDEYQPSYQTIYGRFKSSKQLNKMDVQLYCVNAYEIPEEEQSIEITINGETKTKHITQVYLESELPEDVDVVGYRAFQTLYYKTDFVDSDTQISLSFDLDQRKDSLVPSSYNYINISPTVLQINAGGEKNIDKEINICFTQDAFVHTEENEDWYKNHITDYHLFNSMHVGQKLTAYFVPYIVYEDDDPCKIGDYDYYIPKDIDIFSLYNIEPLEGNTSIMVGVHGLGELEPYRHYIMYDFVIGSNFSYSCDFTIEGYNKDTSGKEQPIHKEIRIIPKTLSTVGVPLSIQHTEDFDRLLESYMPHNCFNDAYNLKDAMRALFRDNNLMNTIVTKTKEFINDNAYYKLCYINNLISILKSMGENIEEYEQTNFEGVNDVRDFVRLMSINHNILVGHKVDEDYDINVSQDYKGQNVGIRITEEDSLKIDSNGKLEYILRPTSDGDVKKIIPDHTCGGLVIQDIFTEKCHYVLFKNYFKDEVISIKDYEIDWGWNLLLPDKFYDSSASDATKKRLIKTYYYMYLLKDQTDQKRIGNFIQEEYLTDDILNMDKWYDQWGETYYILLKLILGHIISPENLLDVTQDETGVRFFVYVNENNTKISIDQLCKAAGIDATFYQYPFIVDWNVDDEDTLDVACSLSDVTPQTYTYKNIGLYQIKTSMTKLPEKIEGFDNQLEYTTSEYYCKILNVNEGANQRIGSTNSFLKSISLLTSSKLNTLQNGQ